MLVVYPRAIAFVLAAADDSSRSARRNWVVSSNDGLWSAVRFAAAAPSTGDLGLGRFLGFGGERRFATLLLDVLCQTPQIGFGFFG